jgi:hypothetical protein
VQAVTHVPWAHVWQAANDIADLLAPQSGAYYDMWLDGEKFVSVYKEDPKVTADRAFNGFGTNYENSPEPLYGTQFLPRKFKVRPSCHAGPVYIRIPCSALSRGVQQLHRGMHGYARTRGGGGVPTRVRLARPDCRRTRSP